MPTNKKLVEAGGDGNVGVVAQRRRMMEKSRGRRKAGCGLLTVEDVFAQSLGFQHLHMPPSQPPNRAVNEQWRVS